MERTRTYNGNGTEYTDKPKLLPCGCPAVSPEYPRDYPLGHPHWQHVREEDAEYERRRAFLDRDPNTIDPDYRERR